MNPCVGTVKAGVPIFSPKVKMTVLLQIIDGGGLTFVDLDLLHPGIALDVDQMPYRTKIVVHVV